MDPKRDGILKVRKITNISWALKIATAKKKKTIMQIRAKDGANLTNDSDILRECNSFYSDLYTTKSTKIIEHLEKRFLAMNITNSTKWIRKKCEGLLTEKECLEAFK